MVPSPAEGSTEEDPRVDVTLSVCERKTGELIFFVQFVPFFFFFEKPKGKKISPFFLFFPPPPNNPNNKTSPPKKPPTKKGGLNVGGGISAQGAADGALPGFIGSGSFFQRNLFGLGQRLAANLEVGQVDKLFRVTHSDPWLLGDRHRTSRVASLQNTRSSGAPIWGAATLEEEEYFGGGGGGLGGGAGANSGGGGGGGGGDYLSPSPSSSYFPADSNAGALDPSGQYAGSPSRSTAAVAAANAADAESPIIISRLTGEKKKKKSFFLTFFCVFFFFVKRKNSSFFLSLFPPFSPPLFTTSPSIKKKKNSTPQAASSTPARSPWAGRAPSASAGSAPRPSTTRGGPSRRTPTARR